MRAPRPRTGRRPVVLPLLADGSLRLEVPHALAGLLSRWLPLLPYADTRPDTRRGAVVRVVPVDTVSIAPPNAPATLRLGSVAAWVAGDTATLRGEGGCAGVVELARGEGRLEAPAGGEFAAVAWDLYSMATLSVALLLGRRGRALVHAAAVVRPDGGCLLLAGDTHAGKTTTVANLVTARWPWVSDDHVVLSRSAGGGIAVEGWPRRFHLDEGWEAGAPLGRRGETDPRERFPGRWRRTAPLAGLLFPRVHAGAPTELAPVPAAEALAGVLRQSPWLLADPAAAPGVLALLTEASAHPAFALRLGLDTYRDADRLVGILAPAAGPRG